AQRDLRAAGHDPRTRWPARGLPRWRTVDLNLWPDQRGQLVASRGGDPFGSNPLVSWQTGRRPCNTHAAAVRHRSAVLRAPTHAALQRTYDVAYGRDTGRRVRGS